MTRTQKALQNHKNGYNCAQSVICAFADLTPYTEDELFRISEALGFGLGGTKSVCGAVSAMVLLAGIKNSHGISSLPDTNKKQSYAHAGQMIKEFEKMNSTILCSTLKGENLRSCDGCIEDAVKILENLL